MLGLLREGGVPDVALVVEEGECSTRPEPQDADGPIIALLAGLELCVCVAESKSGSCWFSCFWRQCVTGEELVVAGFSPSLTILADGRLKITLSVCD